MTRINLVPPEELHRLHLIAEYRELPRVLTLARVCPVPEQYTFGPGHVKFFYNKLLFIVARHRHLVLEMRRRGYSPSSEHLLGMLFYKPRCLWHSFTPSQADVDLSRARILSKLPRSPR